MTRLLNAALALVVLGACGETPATNVSGLAEVATSGSYEDLADKPSLSAVATSGRYADLTGAPALSTVATTGNFDDLNGLPSFKPVALSGDFNDLINKPPLSQVGMSGQYSDLNGLPALSLVSATGNYGDLLGLPVLSRVSQTGAYEDLTGAPSLAPVALLGTYASLTGTPALSSVALSGSYSDLSGRPSLSSVATSGAYADLSGAPQLATLATTGAYSDLVGAPALSAVATSGSYSDLSGKPALSAVAVSGVYSDLVGAPALSTVATSGSYADLSNQPWSLQLPGLTTQHSVSVGAPASSAPLTVGIAALGTPTVDQESPQGGNAFNYQAAVWQSFTPAVSGKLASVTLTLFNGPSSGYTLSLYRGEGTGGALVATQSGFSAQSFQATAFVFTTPVRLEAGLQYTWALSNADVFSMIGYAWGDYPGGRADDPGAPGQHPDYKFQTLMVDSPTRLKVSSSGQVGVATSTPTATFDVDGTVRFRVSRSPASSDPCQKGDQAWDADYVYVCVDTNSWRRAALAAY